MNTNSAMTSVRRHAQNERLEKNIKNTAEKLTMSPNQPVRVTTNLASFILIRHPILISNGVTYSTQVRNIGAGVKELYLEEKK